MDIRKLQRAIVDGLEDVKAQNIVVFNTEALSPLFERVIIASGTSNRQTKALASSVRDSVRARGMQVLRTEGEDNGEWIIVDCGAAVAHIMQPSIRDYYHLEEIWGAKAVRMKIGSVQAGLPKAAEPAPRAAAPAKKAAHKSAAKPAGKKAAAGPGRARPPSAKPAAGAPVARKSSGAKLPAGRAAGGKTPARQVPAGKAPAAKSAVSRPAAGSGRSRPAPAARPAAAPKKAAPRKTARRG